MGEILNKLFDWIKDASVSISKKAIFIIIGIITLIGINEYTGFIYYYPLAKEAEMLYHLEIAKENGKDNSQLVEYINKQEQKIIDRHYLHEPILNLVASKPLLLFKQKDKTVATKPKEIEKKEAQQTLVNIRSTFWHLATTSGFVILLSILFILLIIIYPFTRVNDKWKIIGGSFVLLIPSLFYIWLSQYLWGLLPPILGYIAINYIIQFLFQLFVIGYIPHRLSKRSK